jgi:hypothetical protein
MKRLTIGLFLALSINTLSAQERLGIANSNYAGVNGVTLNPSSMLDSRIFIDLHLVGASIFFHNNYIYLPKDDFHFFQAVRGNEPIPYPLDVLNGRDNNAFIQLSVSGPSAVVSLEKHSIGIHTAQRNYFAANNIPEAQSKFTLEGLTYIPQHAQDYDGKRVSIKSMSWAEVGLSYATIIKSQYFDFITAGVTAKRMYGINHIGFSVDEYKYNVLDTTDAEFIDFTMQYGLTNPGWNIGRGWGADIGMTWKRTIDPVFNYVPHSKKGHCEYLNYRWKLGVSILDIGSIKFDKEAFYNEVENGSGTWQGYDESGVNTVEEVDNLFSNILGDQNRDNVIQGKMPTAVSVQYDYNFENNIYVNGSIVQRFGRTQRMGVHRPNVLAIVPRYERKRFEFSMPFSLYEYRYPMLGAMIRLNSLIIGTDNLGPYFFNTNVFRADIYFALKYSIFKSRKCRTQMKGIFQRSKRKLSREARSCPKFNH